MSDLVPRAAGAPPAPVRAPVPAPVPAPARPRPELVLDAPRPRTRGAMVLGLLSIGLFVGGFSAWSVLAPLSEAAIAPGLIKNEFSRRTIQHLEGGIVREILVRDGDRVTRGQALMRLDDVQSGSTLETLRGQRWSLLAQDARLAAEYGRADAIAFPAELRAAAADPRAAEALAGQQALFAARTVALASQIQVLANRVEQHQAAVVSARQQLRSLDQQVALIRQEERIKRDLMNQGLSRLSEVLALQRSAASLEGNIGDLRGQVERSNAAIAEARSQMRQAEDQRQQEISAERREVQGKLAEAGDRLRAATDVSTRREILAPEDGTVLNLRVFTVGAVLRPGDPALDLVPAEDRLVAEVNLSPTDIDVVYPGLLAEVRLPAFKQRLVPFLDGHVTFVAGDVTLDQRTGASHYRVQILVDREQLARLPNVTLTPGMPVEAMIQIGSRSFLRYITQPLRDSFHRAFREQ